MNKPFIIEDGYIFIIVPVLIAVALEYFVNAYAAVVPALLALYFAYFFRNPRRTIPQDETALVSPADGKVMAIEDVNEDTYMNGKCRKIVIFLSVFDVHVNRAPLAGTINFQQYTCGRFRPAYKDGVGYENERYSSELKMIKRIFWLLSLPVFWHGVLYHGLRWEIPFPMDSCMA